MKDTHNFELYRRVGENIQQLRKRLAPPLSQEALAQQVGMSRVSIANIERGHHRVQLHVLYQIARTLGVEPHDLLPHLDNTVSDPALPPSLIESLSEKERAAVARLLSSDARRGTS